MITSVQFRGKSVDIEYIDHGYDDYTNSQDIDWKFIDKELENIEITDEEYNNIFYQLSKLSQEYEDELWL